MKNTVKKYLVILILIIMFFINTKSHAFAMREFEFARKRLNATSIYGISKIYNGEEVFCYKKDASGSYSQSVDEAEVQSIRNSIKQAINSLNNGEYIISKILKSDTYYNASNKEFCYKRSVASVTTDMLTKVIIVGYDDNYTFKSNLTSKKGAYKVRKLGETEEFYVSYEDTWVESELSKAYDANSITLDKTSIRLKVGDTQEVHYTVLPEDAISKSVTVAYSDGIEIDTETSGTVKIKGVSAGDAYIIVKLKANNEITAKCDITVTKDSTDIPTPVPSPSPNPTPVPSPIPTQIPSPVPSPIESPIPTSKPSPNPQSPTPSGEKIESSKYLVDTNKKYISKIIPKTRISDVKSNITANVDYEIYNKKMQTITEDTVVATGMKLKTQNQEYTMIVKGDIDGNGAITITDVVRAKLYSVHIKTPNEIEKIAADVNGDGSVTITDIVKLKLASVNIKPIE